MTADIDAVLSRLRERPECRDAVEAIERLTAENDTARLHDENRRLTAERDRLREAANVLAAVRADAMWLARLARGSSWPGEMAHRVEVAAERVLSLLGESPVPEPPKPPRNGATLACGCWTYAVMPGQKAGRDSVLCDEHGHQVIEKCNVDEPTAPSLPTGEPGGAT